MKNARLIFGVMLFCIAFFHNLSAGPVNAIKLTRKLEGVGTQTVLLYGDQHDTHEGNEGRERSYIDAFCRELEKIDKETLFLYEDRKFSPMDSIFSEQDQIIFSRGPKKFISTTRDLTDAISKQKKIMLQVQSIDPRVEYLLIEISLMLHQVLRENNFSLSRSKAIVWNNGYEAIKNARISDVFLRFITNVELFAEFANDERAAKIFDDIASTMKARKKLLWKKIIADTGLSKDELNQATVETVAMEMATDRRYAKLADFLLNAELIAAGYCTEVVEAEALWRIVEVQCPYQRIVVVAGVWHVRNLERYLCELGFEKSASAGQEYILAAETFVKAQASWKSILNPRHAERISTLFPGDNFWGLLFQEDIAAAEQAMVNENTILTKEQYQVYSDALAKKQALESFNPVPLIPFETFKWINKSDSTLKVPTKKRPGDELEQPVTKKRHK